MICDLFCQNLEHYSLTEKRTVNRINLLLPGAGCEWFKKNGGCSMCGFYIANKQYTLGGRLWPSLFFKLLFESAMKKLSRGEEWVIFNGGSFVNDNEIPHNFQNWFFSKASKQPLLNEIFFESRCEYLEKSSITRIVSTLKEKKLFVGIGLESQDDRIRNKLINKGLSRQLFEEKIKMLKSVGAFSSVYVFLKPLGLSEYEAYKETLATISYALSVGADRIDLSCAFIQLGTEMCREYRAGRYLPPKLWTILNIIEEVEKNKWPVLIGKFTDVPLPIAIPSNCPKCSVQIYKAIDDYRTKRVLGEIPKCNCSRE